MHVVQIWHLCSTTVYGLEVPGWPMRMLMRCLLISILITMCVKWLNFLHIIHPDSPLYVCVVHVALSTRVSHDVCASVLSRLFPVYLQQVGFIKVCCMSLCLSSWELCCTCCCCAAKPNMLGFHFVSSCAILQARMSLSCHDKEELIHYIAIQVQLQMSVRLQMCPGRQ